MSAFKPNLLKIFFSNQYVYAKVLQRHRPSEGGHYIASASTLEKNIRRVLKENGQSLSDKRATEIVGKNLAERAKDKQVDTIWFDYGPGQRYHGKLKVLLDSIRASGVQVK